MDYPRLVPEETPKMRPPVEIKRSSWNAGMAFNNADPPPGSPAAWQQRNSGSASIARSPSPVNRARSPLMLGVPSQTGMLPPRSLSPVRNPFNFDSRIYNPATPGRSKTPGDSEDGTGATVGPRKGHRYKHSSVSVNFFLEPEARAPLAIPVSLAVPTWHECFQSISSAQARSLAWCAIRISVAALVLYVASREHSHVPSSLATLAHLLAYDGVNALTIAAAEILSNFDAWKSSSLRFPFALQRVEVLLGFALSITMIFVGGDIISHTIQHLAQSLYDVEGSSHAHHHHHHSLDGKTNVLSHLLLVMMSLIVTLPEVIQSPERMGVITLMFSFLILVLPLFPMDWCSTIDHLLTPAMGIAMVWLGWGAAKLSGGMLVMSYGGPDYSQAIVDAVSRDSSVESVSDVNLWQVHTHLWLANMRVVMTGTLNDERRIREVATQAIKSAMGTDIGSNAKWDTTIDITRKEK